MSECGAGVGNPLNASDGIARTPIAERIRDAGLTEIGCLLAWIYWRRGPERGPASPALAPTEDLAQTVLGVLQIAEFVVTRQLGRSPLRFASIEGAMAGQADEWVLDPALGEERVLLEMCERAVSDFPHDETSHSEALDMWRILATAECVAFLRAELADHHLEPEWADLSEAALMRITETHSISQGFYLCWLAVRDVASAYLKHPHARENLGITLRNSLEQKVGRARAERWTLKRFTRHFGCPESSLSAAFSRMMGMQEDYLHAIPSGPNLLRGRAE